MDASFTIETPVSAEGVGLHSGRPSRITLFPAPASSGIVFRAGDSRQDLIPASPEYVVDSHFATTVGVNGTRVQTVEHLMAAAAALGIDSLLVEVEGEEIPALDGSAMPFVALLYAAGKVEFPGARRPLIITKPIQVGEGARWLRIVPAETFRISYTLDLDHPAVGTQVASFSCTERVFVEELASARTYGFLKDVGTMRKNGLARGGSLDNAVVVGRKSVLNGNLRYPDEFVRHKVLDLMGDLWLLGRPVVGHLVARNAGHALHHQLLRAILREQVEPSPASARAPAPSHPVGSLNRGGREAGGTPS
ncbi:MAG: UDP-3-O-acyl-N-acetylglucosamine deacetylase [Candidatus Methylomirabilia bacterium]